MKRTLLALVFALLPATARAEWKPALAIAIGQAMDIGSTMRFNAKYPPGHWRSDGACHEDTEFYRAPDGGYRAARASMVGAALTFASIGLERATRSKPRARKITSWLSYGVGAMGVVQAARNVANCGL